MTLLRMFRCGLVTLDVPAVSPITGRDGDGCGKK
jgi:hypothetical protein